MDLIDKKDGLAPVHPEIILCLLYNLLHVFLAGNGGIDLGKIGAGRMGDDFGEGCLACAGRAVKDDRSQLIGLDGAV